VTDKGYDSDANRAAALARGITPVIPRRENSKLARPLLSQASLQAPGADRTDDRQAQAVQTRRDALREDRYQLLGDHQFACGLMLIESVQTA